MELVQTDPIYTEKKQLNFIDKLFLPLINDIRDMPFIYLSLKISFTIIPAAIAIFLIPDLNFLWYAAYLVVLLAYFLGPYVLMLHNICHRKLFKKKYSSLNKVIPWGIGIFFGQTPETYFHHHVIMHHPENNEPEDLSSTMKYQRDSFGGFLIYLGSFYFTGIVTLVNYFVKKKRNNYAWKVFWGEAAFFTMSILLCFVNFKAALTVFILPLVFVRFAMMAGNWAQHAFIDASRPEDIYGNSITCINSRYNRTCFNDGYHIGHHLRPYMHWTDMPVNFKENIALYEKNNAIVFKGIDYFFIWFLLMTKNYKKLAKQFVHIGPKRKDEEIVQLLKSRTKRIAITG